MPLPRYWVPQHEVESRLAGQWDRQWILGWKEVTSATNERTLIPSLLPSVGIGHKIPIILPDRPHRLLTPCLAACLASFACDYVTRQKLSSTSLTPFTVKQLPVLPPEAYRQVAPWGSSSIAEWLTPRLVELYVTAWDMIALARDLGIGDSAYRWDEVRRCALRCEVDAAFFHLYGIARDDADYIMDTFRIVRRRDEEEFGEYRRKQMILAVYDAMQTAIATGTPYQTILDPPPADPRVAHPPRAEAQM